MEEWLGNEKENLMETTLRGGKLLKVELKEKKKES